MKRIGWLVVAIVLLGSPAFAKDVCIQRASTKLVLSKVKIPKAGASVPLSGLLLASFTPPFQGTITRLNSGELLVAGTYYFVNSTCFERVYLDENFSGSGTVECTSDLNGDLPVTWTQIDCKTVTIP